MTDTTPLPLWLSPATLIHSLPLVTVHEQPAVVETLTVSVAGSRSMPIPDYSAAFHEKVSPLRVGVARTFFFADLDPEIDAAVNQALRVLETMTASLRDVTLPGGTQALLDLRATIRAAEAYAYHKDFVERSPELWA